MLNLFKKKEQPKQVAVADEPKASYPEIVHQIHREFLTAGDKALEEARSILSNIGNGVVDKGSRLAALGFKNAPEVAAAKGAVRTAEFAAKVEYYQMNYPNNKFIVEEQVMQICEKYSLVLGDVSAYKGFVPEQKLSQIEKFNLKECDRLFAAIHDTWNGEIVGYLFEDEIVDVWAKKQVLDGNHFYVVAGGKVERYVKNGEKYRYLGKGLPSAPDERYLLAKKEGVSLKICAPIKDMELRPNQMVSGHKIKNIPDPVVLQPVKDGYLIVTAWGDEASDELVINEKQN